MGNLVCVRKDQKDVGGVRLHGYFVCARRHKKDGEIDWM
jgi:hypothetical protein